MNSIVFERQCAETALRTALGVTAPLRQSRPGGAAAPGQGNWLAGLSEPLRQAILGRARTRQVVAGTPLAQRGDAPACWVGVTRGAVRLGSSLADGRSFTLAFVGPGQWFGDIELIDDRPLDLDLIAHVDSTLQVVTKADLMCLIDAFDELRDALLQLNCERLRHMLRRFEELQTLSLAQRLARQVQRLARQFGRATPNGTSIELGVSQGDLAAMVGGSRQRVNRAWRQMQQLGIVRLGQARLMVLDSAALADVAEGRVALVCTASAACGEA